MGGNPREHVKESKGFWDGGTSGHGENGQTGGRASGVPGIRVHRLTGVRTDLEFPQIDEARKYDPK